MKRTQNILKTKGFHGTNRAVYSADGVLKNVTDHYPFGKRMPERWMVTDAEGKRYPFTGHEFDEETGYGYHGARYYNRELGRYMNVDPQMKYHESPYTYAADNPVWFVDVNGEDSTVHIIQRQYQKGITMRLIDIMIGVLRKRNN